jgi:hypothetical protein
MPVTLRGVVLAWGSPSDSTTSSSGSSSGSSQSVDEVQLAFASVDWTSECSLVVKGADQGDATGVELTMDSHSTAMTWFVAIVRSIAFANEVQANFTPSAYREMTTVKVVVDIIMRGSRYSLRVPASMTPKSILNEAVQYIQTTFVQPGSQ